MLRTRLRAGPVANLVLSVVFAVLFTALNSFDQYVESWTPQIAAPTRTALRLPSGARIVKADNPNASLLVYEHRRVTIPPFTVLDETKDDHREVFAYESLRRPPKPLHQAAYFVIYATLSFMLSTYMRRLGQSRVRLLRTHIGVFGMILLVLALAKAVLLFTGLPEYWVPVATIPIWIAIAFDRRTALLVNVMVAFVTASLLRFDLMLLTVALVRGMTVTLMLFNRKRARQLVLAGTVAGLATAVLYMAISVVFEGAFRPLHDLRLAFDSRLLACVGGGALSGLIASVLRDPAERLLGHVPRDRLLDLTDIENPLLKKLALEAPGTWEHSRAMANLAEAAAAAIGADALLTRVGAYYHDIGKTVQAKYFVENLAAGEPSPHDELDPQVSADAIMAHVVLGTKLLREGRVPEPVIEFVYTHHGTQLVEYFWNKCQEQGNAAGLDEDKFRYPGMKPQTKETAIVMLVDSIEAASRTVDPPEYDRFEEMIRRVIFYKLGSGQLDESGLRMEDLRVLIGRLATTLVNVYHARIKYPWQRQEERLPAHTFTTPAPQPVQPLVLKPPEPPPEEQAPASRKLARMP
jgi:putative nucleotidyltransferase with HDIG domain